LDNPWIRRKPVGLRCFIQIKNEERTGLRPWSDRFAPAAQSMGCLLPVIEVGRLSPAGQPLQWPNIVHQKTAVADFPRIFALQIRRDRRYLETDTNQ